MLIANVQRVLACAVISLISLAAPEPCPVDHLAT